MTLHTVTDIDRAGTTCCANCAEDRARALDASIELQEDLNRYARWRVSEPEAARDLVQQTYLAALQANPPTGGTASVRNWLLGILRHKIADYYRRVYRERRRVGTRSESEPAEIADSANHARDPQAGDGLLMRDAVEREEFWSSLTHCLQDLPTRVREAFRLHQIEGRPGADVCAQLDITPGNLWVMLHRARARLQTCLLSQGYGTEG